MQQLSDVMYLFLDFYGTTNDAVQCFVFRRPG